MARDRDWVDYTNLAANVAQTAQLGGINSKMQQLAELEGERDMRQQQEAARAAFEDSIREAVFTYGEQLRDVEELASQNPVAAYIRANHLKRLYAAISQFKASNFRNYDDKERLANIQRGCERLIGDCARRLKTDELEASDRCVDYAFERKELIQLISVQEKREQLEVQQKRLSKSLLRQQASLEQIKEALRSLNRPAWLKACRLLFFMSAAVSILSILALACGAICLLLAIGMSIFGEKDFTGFSWSELWPSQAVALAQIGVSVFLLKLCKRSGYERRKDELAKQAAALEFVIANRNQEVARREAEINEHQSLYTKFGTASSDDYRNMLRERDTLMKHMLGSFVKPDFGEEYYNSLGNPPMKIGRWWMRGQDAEGCTFPPVEEVLETLASRVGAKNADWIVQAIQAGTPIGQQAAIELYMKTTGADLAEAQKIIAEVKNEVTPGLGLA